MRAGSAAALLLWPGLAGAAPVVAQDQQVVASAREPGDEFGARVAIDGDRAFVAAPLHTVNLAGACGAVFPLTRGPDGWVHADAPILGLETALLNREFGRSVAVDGGLLAVGAPGYAADVGYVHVFAEAAGVWTSEALLINPEGKAGDRLGAAVAVSGTTVVAGATTAELPVEDEVFGKALVFTRDDAWASATPLAPLDGEPGDRFGVAVGVSGDVAVVGAPGKEDQRGAAYVFVRGDGEWTQQAKLVHGGTREPLEFFGASVAIRGDTIAVGAPGRADGAGAAFVFVRDGDKWSELQAFAAEPVSVGESVGAEVSLGDGRLLVSGWNFESDDPDVGGRGGAYLLGRGADGFVLLAALRADDGVPGDHLGLGAALSGRTALLGAPQDDAPADPYKPKEAPGSAYFFELVQSPGDPCAVDEDCADGARCCDEMCADACEAATSTGEDPTTGAGESSSGEVPVDPTTGTSSGGPPFAEIDPASRGCGCASEGGGRPWGLLATVLLGTALVRRRRARSTFTRA